MSNPFKAVGKVFKKVVKVVKKVAIPALMIGAVVMTGGAALGALPAMGTMLGSIGISGTLASVLGGAISMGAVGAVTGGLGAAVTGGNPWKAAQGGFLAGAATGGVLGAAGVIGANGVFGANGILGMGQGAGATPLGAGGASIMGPAGQAMPAAAQIAGGGGIPITAAQAHAMTAGVVGAPAAAGTAAATAGGGLGGLLGANAPALLQGAGQIISGFSKGAMADKQLNAQKEEDQAEYDRISFNYGYRNIYDKDRKGRTIGGVPTRQEQWHEYAPQQLGSPDEGLLRTAFAGGPRQPYYQIVNGQVVAVGG